MLILLDYAGAGQLFALPHLCYLNLGAGRWGDCLCWAPAGNLPDQWHQMVIELLVKEMEDGIGLVHNIQEKEVGILGIGRRNA